MNNSELNQNAQDALVDSPAALGQERRRISLATWLTANYSDADAPTPNTVRRWVREERIQPAPEKQGRSYYFSPNARYVAPGSRPH